MVCHACKPSVDGRIRAEIKATLMRNVGIGVEADVSNGEAIANKVGAR